MDRGIRVGRVMVEQLFGFDIIEDVAHYDIILHDADGMGKPLTSILLRSIMPSMFGTIVLILVVVAFAWNLGVHYTGAVMGMPYAVRAISLWPSLVLIAILVILGATFASGQVEETVGQHIIDDRPVTVTDAIVVVLSAGTLTILYNYWKIPTSTIQILVFCVVGVGLGGNIPINWGTIGALVVVWLIAPVAAFALGFLFTRLLDLIVPPAAARS